MSKFLQICNWLATSLSICVRECYCRFDDLSVLPRNSREFPSEKAAIASIHLLQTNFEQNDGNDANCRQATTPTIYCLTP
jgi:hypothetical protein